MAGRSEGERKERRWMVKKIEWERGRKTEGNFEKKREVAR